MILSLVKLGDDQFSDWRYGLICHDLTDKASLPVFFKWDRGKFLFHVNTVMMD